MTDCRALIVHWLSAALMLYLFGIGNAQGKEITRLSPAHEAILDSLEHPEVDPHGYLQVVAGSVWQTPVGTYQFQAGRLAFFRSVGGRPSGCLFEGQARFKYEPPLPVERGQLKRFCSDSALDVKCVSAYWRFFDTATASALRACADGRAKGRLPKPASLRRWEATANQDLSGPVGINGLRYLTRPAQEAIYLHAMPTLENQRRLHLIWDEGSTEAVAVLRQPSGAPALGTLDLVCSYDLDRTDVEAARRKQILEGGFHIARYISDMTIRQSARCDLDVTVEIIPHREGMRDVPFLLAPDLEIDSVVISGDTVEFVYNDDSGTLLLLTPTPLASNDTVRVRFYYHGDQLLSKNSWGDFSIRHTTTWLPVGQPLDRAEYDIRFRFPKHFDLIASGELLQDTVFDGWRIKHWRSYGAASFVSFNYGSFDHLSLQMMDGPRLDIYRSEHHPEGLFSGDIKKAVAFDIEGAIRLFSKTFGPYPWPHLAATEIPSIHGQGFPQLLHLAWYSFETSKPGITDVFRAHEVAHQWFGHQVGWATYHDQWLSEAFAEYAGGMYVQARHPGNQVFEKVLREWRDNVLEVGGHDVWHSGPHVAPIWLGLRCASASSPGSYGSLVYSKGAYVLHMLRLLMNEAGTKSDDRFRAMMTDYVQTMSGKEARTEDFQRIVEKHVGEPMNWFFDQWIYGVDIPRLEYLWERKITDDGRWMVVGTIDQHDVDSTFRTDVPVTVVHGQSRTTTLQRVAGSGSQFELGPFETKPSEVLFNDALGVLCRERVVGKPR